ncbi:MAG: type VI secretion system protein TssA [Oscillochloris sp.]|nr:type VI secretion system protein TssA [Oscillochloris sp.]
MSHATYVWPPLLPPLLQPIPGLDPVGESLRHSEVYDQIKEARRADDPNLPQGIWQTQLKQADWDTVAEICVSALATRSKDLQIAAWLLEAWLHLHEMAGVAAGVELLGGLCEQFWNTVHPQIDGDDFELRLSPFRWMDEKLALELKRIAFTRPGAADPPVYSWLDWENALYWEHLARANGHSRQDEAVSRVTLAQFRESNMLSPTAFYAALAADLCRARTATETLERFLAERCADYGPALAHFAGVLQDMHSKVDTILAGRDDGEVALEQEPPSSAAQTNSAELRMRSRADAYQRLAEIADYLLRIEPHSPTPFLVRRAVAWGNLSWTDLVLELVQSPGDKEAIFSLLGIKQGGD